MGLHYRLAPGTAPACSTGSSAAAYIVRFIAALFFCLIGFLFEPHLKTTSDIYLLGTCIADGFRVHTLWAAFDQPGKSTGNTLTALQTVIIVVTVTTLILSEYKSSTKIYGIRRRIGPAHVDEPNSGLLSMLFLGWLWPLLVYGGQKKIVSSDLESSVVFSEAKHNTDGGWKTGSIDKVFFSEFGLHLLVGAIIQMLSAGATLAQPFIVQGIISYLQSGKSSAIGIWLVIAMVFE